MLKQRPREGKKILSHIEGTATNIEHDTQKSSSYSVSQLQIEYKGNLKTYIAIKSYNLDYKVKRVHRKCAAYVNPIC